MTEQFQKTIVNADNFFNFFTSQEKRIDKIYKKFFKSKIMPKERQKHLKPVETIPGIMHCYCKVHKKMLFPVVFQPFLVDFQTIKTALQTPRYKIAM